MAVDPPDPAEQFRSAAAERRGESLVGELLAFLRHNRKWWLLPLLAVVLLAGFLAYLGTTAAAPFIYTLF